MPTLANTAEGGTNTTTVTAGNSGGASQNAFGFVNIGAGSAFTFDNAHVRGSLAYKIVGTSGTATYGQWTTAMGSQGTIYGRIYLYLTANPATIALPVFRCFNGGTFCATVKINTTGTVGIDDSTGASMAVTTSTVSLNTWIRVEWKIVHSTTVGQAEVRLYNTADAASPTQLLAGAASFNTFATTSDDYRFGKASGNTNVDTFWMDDLGLSSSGFMGVAGARVTAEHAEAVVAQEKGARVTSEHAEAVVTQEKGARVTAEHVEAVFATVVGVRTSAEYVEVLVVGAQGVRTAAEYVEAVVVGAQGVRTSAEYVEVLTAPTSAVLTVEVLENGTVKQTFADVGVGADGVFSFTWDSTILTDPTGAGVEFRFTAAGVPIEVGAVEWNATRAYIGDYVVTGIVRTRTIVDTRVTGDVATIPVAYNLTASDTRVTAEALTRLRALFRNTSDAWTTLTQRLAPDAILIATHLAGAVAAIQDDPDAADGSWLTTDGTVGDVRVSFPTPASTPSGTQEFRVRVRPG